MSRQSSIRSQERLTDSAGFGRIDLDVSTHRSRAAFILVDLSFSAFYYVL